MPGKLLVWRRRGKRRRRRRRRKFPSADGVFKCHLSDSLYLPADEGLNDGHAGGGHQFLPAFK